MSDSDITTAPVGADNMRGALTAYGIDPAASVTDSGARDVIRQSDKGEGARAVWVYWVTEGCDVESRWDVPRIKRTLGLSDSAVTKDKKIGALLARCGTHAADTMTVKRGGITLYRATKRASNDWDKKTCAEAFGSKAGVPLRDAIWSAWDTLTSRAAADQDAYGRPRKPQTADTADVVILDADAVLAGDVNVSEDDVVLDAEVSALTSSTTDATRCDAVAMTLSKIKRAQHKEAAETILAHAVRIALTRMSADDVVAYVLAATEAEAVA